MEVRIVITKDGEEVFVRNRVILEEVAEYKDTLVLCFKYGDSISYEVTLKIKDTTNYSVTITKPLEN